MANSHQVDQKALDKLTKSRYKRGECPTCGQKTHEVKKLTKGRKPLSIEGKVITGICLKCHPIEGYARREDTDKAGPAAYEGHAGRPKIPNYIDPKTGRGTDPDDDQGTLVSGLTLDPVFRNSDSNHLSDQNNRLLSQQSENAYDTFCQKPNRIDAIRKDRLMAMNQNQSRNSRNSVTESGSFTDRGIANPGSGKSDLRELNELNINDDVYDETNFDQRRRLVSKGMLNEYEESCEPSQRKSQLNLQDPDPYSPISPFTHTQYQSFQPSTPNADNRRKSRHLENNDNHTFRDSKSVHQRLEDTERSRNNNALIFPVLLSDEDSRPHHSNNLQPEFLQNNSCGSSRSSAENQNYLPRNYTITEDNTLESFLDRQRQDPKHQSGYYAPSVSSGRTGNLSQEEKNEIEPKTNIHRSLDGDNDPSIDNSVSMFDSIPPEVQDNPAEDSSPLEEVPENLNYRSSSSSDGSIKELKKKIRDYDDGFVGPDVRVYNSSSIEDGNKKSQDYYDKVEETNVYHVKRSLTNERNDKGKGFHREESQKPFDEETVHSPESPQRSSSSDDKLSDSKGGKKKAKISDIPIIIKCMQMHKSKDFVICSALEALFDLATLPDTRGKEMILQHDGIACILENIWAQLDNAKIQIAAFNALWALFALELGYQRENSDPLLNANLSGIIDAIMISMQTNSHNPTVQQVGCGALSCIAASKSRGIMVEDAGNSQIIVTLLNSMREHPTHIGVQEWALRAIFNHCLNFESGKSFFSNRSSVGTEAICRAMCQFPKDLGIQEWACRVYCCLTMNVEVAKALPSSRDVVRSIISAIKRFNNVLEAELMLEAAYSSLANFCTVSESCVDIAIEKDIIDTVLQSMDFFGESDKVQIETCVTLSSLCISKDAKSLIVNSGGIETILNAMKMFPDDKHLQEEASRALSNVCHEFPPAKEKLASKESIDVIMRILRRHVDIEENVEIACELLCTLTVSHTVQTIIFKYDLHHIITEILVEKSENKRILELVCCLLRNLSTNKVQANKLANFDIIRQVIRAMVKHSLSEEIQMHSCVMFWNLSAELRKNVDTILHSNMIERIVGSLQNFPTIAIIQQVACGALWSLMINLEDIKRAIVEAGGIDALIVALVMYQTDLNVLENVCGALSSLSAANESLNKTVSEGGVGYIIETMRNNPSSSTITIYGSIFLRNASIANKNYAEEASAGASTIVRGMNEHLDDIYLQKECISALRTLASHSETCKERILGANGSETIQHVMNIYRSVEDIQRLGSATLSIFSNT